MASSIQFKGIDGVIEAYENRGVAAWSLWQGKQFMFKYEGHSIEEGAQQLQATLELLAQSTNAIYTLKVYEELTGGKIKSNTPDDGSFNFKINGDEQALTQSQYTSYRNSNEIVQRLADIEDRLNQQEEKYEPEPSRLGFIGEILSDPGLQPIVQPLIAKIFGTAAPSRMPRAAINGINDDERVLSEAITELKKHDTRLHEHLAKLAAIAKENPQSFNFLLTTLDSM